ncbi:MAG TPA: hypothetical protein VMY18_04250 [Acidobacteriota bacterium]|nr:hypothetical protein [Acidobacteriota bacterium]
METRFPVGLNAVIVAVTGESPRVLTVQAVQPGSVADSETVALPFGPLDPIRDRTMERGVRGWVREQTGLELGYVEQLYTFGDRDRDGKEGGPRVLSVAYLALVREEVLAGNCRAQWLDCYDLLQWEDWRSGCPQVVDERIIPALTAWAELASTRSIRATRKERVAISFGLDGTAWDGEKVLERYELLYEAGLVCEAIREVDPGTQPPRELVRHELGRCMVLDHRRMLATALGRLRGKIKYRPVVFGLLAPTFTLLQLQRVVEALAGVRLHKQNFRRLVDKGGLVEGTGSLDENTGGRPAELFRFRREVLRERSAPGVGLPGGTQASRF